MARSVIGYDEDLPEIPGRLPWLKPDAHLVKDAKAETGWRVVLARRENRLLLVPGIRTAVDDWHAQGYQDESEFTRRLSEYWFEENHDVPGFSAPFRYCCQWEAMWTPAWLLEIAAEIETKGRVWEGTRAKDEAIGSWCRRVSEQTSEQWRYIRINQKDVDLSKSVSLAILVDGIQKRVPNIFNAGG